MPPDLDPPELGNEDEVFTGLLEQARRNAAAEVPDA